MSKYLLIALILFTALPTRAEDLASLQSQLAALKTQSAQIQSQIDALQQKIDRLSQSPAALATEDTQPKAFHSIEEILNLLPKELHPTNGLWDEFDAPKLQTWLNANIAGEDIELPLVVDQVAVGKNLYSGTGPEDAWLASFTIRDIASRIASRKINTGVANFRITGNSDLARTWNKTKSGTVIHIKASIASLKYQIPPSYAREQAPCFILTLKDITLAH